MDLWPNNCKEWWDEVQAKGTVVQLSVNYDGGTQGWYVPSYVVKGDPERGLEPMAPDLKTVFDLKRYWRVFMDPEEKDKGRFLNGPGSWVAYGVNNHKLKSYGLDDFFVSFSAGSTTGIEAEVSSAYKKGKPILFYFWDPTWLMGKYDFIRLEEPPFDPLLWTPEEGYSCDWVKGTSFIVANHTFSQKHPGPSGFLKSYSTTLEQNRAALVYIRENKTTPEEAALWFMKTYPETWKKWIPADRPEVLNRLNNAVKEAE
jgi:glycine betaine/proline transport system substrate-binding protein